MLRAGRFRCSADKRRIGVTLAGDDPYSAVPYGKGKTALEKYGPHMIDQEGDIVTPLVNGNEECAFAFLRVGLPAVPSRKRLQRGNQFFANPFHAICILSG